MKSMRPISAAIFFMTYFYRTGGALPRPRIRYWFTCLMALQKSLAMLILKKLKAMEALYSKYNRGMQYLQKKIKHQKLCSANTWSRLVCWKTFLTYDSKIKKSTLFFWLKALFMMIINYTVPITNNPISCILELNFPIQNMAKWMPR